MRSKLSDLSSNIPSRLRTSSSVWKQFVASREILGLVKHGHKMSFKTMPTLSQPKPEFSTKLPSVQMKIIRSEIKDLFSKGAVRKISLNEAISRPGFFSKLFAVPKPGGKWRTIIDMRSLNSYINKESFRMDGIKDVKNLLSHGYYGCVVDLSDAYYHISIHPSCRKYTRFVLDGVIYEYTGLPMGLTCSPRIFTKVAKFAATWLRKRGVLLVIYIDDLLVLGRSADECDANTKLVVNFLTQLGFGINEGKCSLVPSTKFLYLGCVWNTVDWTVSLKGKREEGIRSSASALLTKKKVTVRDVSRFVGRMQSAVGVIPLARARSRAIMRDLTEQCKSEDDYNKPCVLSSLSRQQLEAWSCMASGLSMPITVPGMQVVTVHTDASETGFGWYFNGRIISEDIPKQWVGKHINLLELQALRLFLLSEDGSKLNNLKLTWRVDSNPALFAIRK